MGVITTADEKRDQAKEKLDQIYKDLKDAINLLEEASDPNTWSEFSTTYTEKLEQASDDLMIVKRDVSRIKNKI